jgi:hypothetical protein
VKVCKIISGGQTGVDRAALDFAQENNFESGGYVPQGREAEDGRISEKYPNLIETSTADHAERTELNVLHSDATLIISRGAPAGGSKLTAELVAKHKKPFLYVDLLPGSLETQAERAKAWLQGVDGEVLNIAGPRASEDPEIYSDAAHFLEMALLS